MRRFGARHCRNRTNGENLEETCNQCAALVSEAGSSTKDGEVIVDERRGFESLKAELSFFRFHEPLGSQDDGNDGLQVRGPNDGLLGETKVWRTEASLHD